MLNLLRKLRDAIRRRLRSDADAEAVLARRAAALDPAREKHLTRLRDETLARITFGQG